MIDVLKRLAELDAQNPNVAKTVVKEDAEIAECGPQGLMGGAPSTPASINMTAGSGEDLSNMLATIMQLAGVHKVGDEHMGVEPEPSVMTAEPSMSASDSMRSVIDKMHNDGAGEEGDEEGDEEETDEGAMYDNTPNDPTDKNEFDANEFASHPNDGDGDGEDGKKRTMAQPTATYENLMAEYKKFIGE